MPKSPQFDIESPEDDWCPPDIYADLLKRKWLLKLVWAIIVLAAFILGISSNVWEAFDQFMP